MQWIFGSKDKEALILWLYGPAGAGKSAILQSIAEKCAELEIIIASFFFSRSDNTRNHHGSLVATIASQISTKVPQIIPILDAVIAQDHMIFSKTLGIQINSLIVEPLQSLIGLPTVPGTGTAGEKTAYTRYALRYGRPVIWLVCSTIGSGTGHLRSHTAVYG